MNDNDKISVLKNVKLEEGEELGDFVNKVFDALAQHRQKAERSVFLRGIFKGFIITRDFENGKFFQMKLSRDKEGLIKLGDPIHVRQTFVPVMAKVEKSEDAPDQLQSIELPPTLVIVKGGKLTAESITMLENLCDAVNGEAEEDDYVAVEKKTDESSLFAGTV